MADLSQRLNFTGFDQIIDEAIQECKELAFSGNIDRQHHLESAVESFADIGQLLEAKKLVHELLDDPEAEEDE